jgi:hypothetical protein
MRIHSPVIVTLASTIAATAVVAHQGQPAAPGPQKKPVVTEYIVPLHAGPAVGSTVEDMVLAAELVVGGRVAGSKPRTYPLLDNPEGDVYTLYTFRIDEVFHVRGGGSVGSEIAVIRMGGTRELADRIEQVVDPGFPQLRLGRRYILFLQWGAYHDAWIPMWSPNSVYDVEGERVEPFGKAKTVVKYEGMPVSAFVAALRAAGHGR